MKYDKGQLGQLYYGVALFTRAWIEIQYISLIRLLYTVALFTRAWIEIDLAKDKEFRDDVALFTRAWIEIRYRSVRENAKQRRPLHEGVD